MIKNIEGKIISVTDIRSGTGKFGPWTMFEVVISTPQNPHGEMFTTFDNQYQGKLQTEGMWTYKEEVVEGRTGKQFTRRTLEKLPKQGQNQQVMEELAKLSRKMDEVLELVSIRTTIKHPIISEAGVSERIGEDIIPF